jgi:hypothetical protein
MAETEDVGEPRRAPGGSAAVIEPQIEREDGKDDRRQVDRRQRRCQHGAKHERNAIAPPTL